MPLYRAPVEDVLFLLRDVIGYERHANLAGFAQAPLDVAQSILQEGGRFCEEVLQPLNRVGDRHGCRRENDRVITPPGFRDAYQSYAAAGWVGLAADPAVGGQGLPYVLAVAMSEFVSAANMAWGMYPGLTQGAIAALSRHGTAEQKALYLTRLVSGAWTGTMNLTEPQCGTDLGLIRTRAARRDDGSFAVTGQKIFISAGDHDLADNIVHLVLARIDGAPPGVKGLSLFIVPKRLPDADGNAGAPNRVSCGALEEKMGIHGNATCAMDYDGAQGWLLGQEERGLAAMFTMMNEARIGVGVQGLALSEVAYQNAAAYARERRQGRALNGARAADSAADPIIVHPDIRRGLMTIAAFNEAARALVLWTALAGDLAGRAEREDERRAAEDRLGLLTPVVKAVLTDRGFDNAVAAQQIFGGSGYIAESGMEQFVRDARIAMIYEGTNGIQALDLVGRKLGKDGGRAVSAFLAEIEAWLKEHEGNDDLAAFAAPLRTGLEHLRQATMWFLQHAVAKPDNAGAGATDYLHLFGLVALGYMWARIAAAAVERLAAEGDSRPAYYERKLTLGRFYMERVMPETALRLARVAAGADTLMRLPAEAF